MRRVNPSDTPTCQNDAIIAPLSLLVWLFPIGVSLRLPFFIYTVQYDGDLHFVEATQTFDDAKGRVTELGEVWPGEYIIDDEETGKRVFVSTRDESKN